MKLFSLSEIPVVGAAGPAFASIINTILEWVDRRADAVVIPAVVGGAVDNTSMIEDYLGDAPYGSTVRFADPGPVGCGAIPAIQRNVRLIGAGGRFGTVLVPLEDTAEPILDFDMAGGVGIYEAYGPSLERIAIDLAAAPSAIGVRVGANTGWFEADRVFVQGGWRCIEHHGPNATFTRLNLQSPTDCMMYIDDSGLEVEIDHAVFARNIAGTTDAYMKVILASSGQKGDLRLNRIQAQSGPLLGMYVDNGIIITAPSLTNVPVFAKRVTLDNVVGGGPGLTLTNVESVDWEGGWINSAAFDGAHPGGPCVRITGGGDLTFRGVKYRGGGSPTKTYDFVGGSTRGFRSKDCYCPTGPVYYLPASGAPTDVAIDDDIPGATVLSQITNDVEGLRAAAARRWGPFNLQDRLNIASVPWTAAPFMQVGVLGGDGTPGEAVIPAPDVDADWSHFIPFRFSPSGMKGRLEIKGKDAVAQTVTVWSLNDDDTVRTADTSTVGVLRFDLPH